MVIEPDLSHSVLTDFGGERLALLPERAVSHQATGTLYIADLHIGKSATFRAAGIPIPDGDTEQDLARLARALNRTAATRLVILGDFLHAEPGRRDPHWETWRTAHARLEVLVVRGNHDQHAGDAPGSWNVAMRDEPFRDGPFTLRHHPEAVGGELVLAGHLHPAVLLRGTARDRVSLPAFHFSGGLGVLPAFTAFAGGYPVRASRGDRVFGIAEEVVMDVSRIALAG